MKEQKNIKGYRCERNGWNYVRVEGDAGSRGRTYGSLMAEEIASALEEAKRLMILQTGLDWEFFKESEESIIKVWEQHINTEPYLEYLDELCGVIEGVQGRLDYQLDIKDLLIWNGLEELTNYWFPTVAGEIYNNLEGPGKGSARTFKEFHLGAPDRCSAFIATGSYTEDHKIVVAHNTFSPFEYANFQNVVVEVLPSNGNRFIMQSQPGFLHSLSDFYITSTGEGKGLMITETTIGGFHAYAPQGVPEFLRIRRAVQYADTLDSFVDIFKEGNNGGYANTWLVGDIETGEIMRYEAGLKFHKTDRLTDGYFVGFNAALDPRIRNFECTNNGFADIRRHQGARQVRLPQLMEEYKGRLNMDIAKAILADHYDVYTGKEEPNSRTVCSHYELDDRRYMSRPGGPVPFQPRGAVDGIVACSRDAAELSFSARWGSSCGMAFEAEPFLQQHPQFEYLREFLKDRPSQPWTKFPPREDSR